MMFWYWLLFSFNTKWYHFPAAADGEKSDEAKEVKTEPKVVSYYLISIILLQSIIMDQLGKK